MSGLVVDIVLLWVAVVIGLAFLSLWVRRRRRGRRSGDKNTPEAS